MRVLQVHNQQLHPGGVDEVIRRESAVLTREGHEVDQYFETTGSYLTKGRVRQASSVVWNVGAANNIRRRLSGQAYDIVHVHTPFPFLSGSVIHAARTAGVPTVMTVHSYRISCVKGTFYRDGDVCTLCLGTKARTPAVAHSCYHDSRSYSAGMAASLSLHHLIGTFTEKVSMFLALTPFMARMLEAEGVPPERIFVHPNFIEDPGGHRTGSEGFVFTGRLVPEKGVSTMVEAWRLLGVDAPPLSVIGEGPLAEDIVALSHELPQVRYLGRLSNADVISYLRGAGCLLFPSLWFEGLGLAWVEALAVGTPLIYSDVGNFTEIVDGFDVGLRHGAGNSQSLAEAVKQFSQADDSERVAFGQRARLAYESNYAADAATERLISFYESAMGTNDAPPAAS